MLVMSGELERAAAALDMAVRANGRSTEALVERAVIRTLTGRVDEGQRDLRTASKLGHPFLAEFIESACERVSRVPGLSNEAQEKVRDLWKAAGNKMQSVRPR